MLLKCMRATALALLFTLTACGGFDTGLNPLPDVRKEQGPLTAPPAGVLRGVSGEPAPAYTPTNTGAGARQLALRAAGERVGVGLSAVVTAGVEFVDENGSGAGGRLRSER